MTDITVKAATKLLRERIPTILDFVNRPAAYTIMAGVEDLARDILMLASPAAPPPEEIVGLIDRLEKPNALLGFLIEEAAAALRLLAQENERLKDDLRRAILDSPR